MDKTKLLKKIHAQYALNCSCSLRKNATQAVFGEGDAYARLMFIGEAPGKNEDIQGTPFIGASGKFLSEMLASIHLQRKDVYITNIVKYRPPENRDPLPAEKAACREWLVDEIALIDPILIITLGRHAMKSFLPEEQIAQVHGKIFKNCFPDIGQHTILPLYHPAAALYNSSLRETLKQDFLRIPKILNDLGRSVKSPTIRVRKKTEGSKT